MGRPRKVEVTETVTPYHEGEDVMPVEVAEPVAKVNVKKLIPFVWKGTLEQMQEAVAEVQGDNLTMQAVQGIMKATNSGIASQFLQQIIQRNS
jgi:hypothetical protein